MKRAMETRVEIAWIEKQVEDRIRFGHAARSRIVDHYRHVVLFSPGAVFCLQLWRGNEYGTIASRIDILVAPAPNTGYITIPQVRPGAMPLLRISGWPKVERVLHVVDAVEALGIDPADVSPEYWHHLHNRLTVGDQPRSYTRSEHAVWLRRRMVMS